MPEPIQHWLNNLKQLNINVMDVCFENFLSFGTQPFKEIPMEEWNSIKTMLSQEKPIHLQSRNSGYLLGYLLNQQESLSCFGLYLAPPINESTLEIIRTSLGWVFYQHQNQQLRQGWNSEQLLEIFAHVINQSEFRIAAQEWINQTTTFIRNQFSEYENIQLNYFYVQPADHVEWLVSSDLSWTEKGSADMQKMKEIALQAVMLQHEINEPFWWAYPVFNHGVVQAVLVAKDRKFEQTSDHTALTMYLQNNVDLMQPLLSLWKNAEQGLVQHGIRTGRNFFGKYTQQGNYAWKIITLLLGIFLLGITLIPVDKLVTSKLNVEGKTRWIIAAPMQGFITQVLVRPGDKVTANQTLIKLDDTDLKIQLAEQQSLLDQAQHQFRVAMAEQNLTDSGLAANQIRQQETKIQTIQRKLIQTHVVSPLHGTVIDGDWVQQTGTPIETGKELFQIASQDAYKVILHVADQDIHLVKTGQNGVLKLTSFPDQTFKFKITRIMPVATVQNNINGFRVEAAWQNSPPALTPGMQGVGKITVGQTNLLFRWSRDFINWMKLKIWSTW
ncbi:efflux RND transporter periplasmic adaptor subunit [Acinetobacter sp. C_4_1]|uniref:efflux RND transporter periplasmic adaptor subunit n=1 Tax=unclassified Acinetobacter TaxID=196816 RepID=UPI0021B74146|nr:MULTISPECIES: efflux RND transporter periplasmic adaptor subunit [unclassified Acinetobacter]MCT8089061.1 efflux RND transporter periplasmic adaptor subunit [Acinetobacter sp. F_3_1]MCT8097216.1 efflux RND transporter periplasmic adaptor subunit [Acinetobacter sp. C_3_1]MCT8100092.1 efflux RND transporter periplasmic adaptor subunit [Acinetobacter sp. C_4_1]MCT8133282.1 efflux RND transporter periplasmic adaptor subunit [Acinetobacter sp. T_3_1]